MANRKPKQAKPVNPKRTVRYGWADMAFDGSLFDFSDVKGRARVIPASQILAPLKGKRKA